MGIAIYNAGESTTYVLRRELNHGQEGQTFAADQVGPQGVTIRVAIKILDPASYLGHEVDANAMLELWRSQLQVARSFSHQGFAAAQVAFAIAAVPTGPHATPPELVGRPASVLGWVEGEQLDHWAAPIKDRRARLAALTQAAAALDAFHRKTGHVHRDLKPANIMVENGQAVIVDFGLLRTADRLNTGTALLGTPAYSDPSIADAGAYASSCDVYSFAGVIFYLLTGQHPSNTRSVQRVRAMVSEAGFDQAGHTVAMALSPDPAARPVKTATALLERVTQKLPDAARPKRVAQTTVRAYEPPPTVVQTKPERSTQAIAARIVGTTALATSLTLGAVVALRAIT